ncbi:MAG TPA: cellulose-binding domain-containing protein, partial [Bacillota bacterium]|nr:cellulose-binding domain-containing protein [Bacillota bacterium]
PTPTRRVTPTSRPTSTPTPIPTGMVTPTVTRTITPTPYRRPSLIPEYYISTGAATNITDTSATLGGSARLQGYTSVTISISCTDGTKTFGGSGVATVSNPYVSVNVTGLKPDTQYSYYAAAGSGGPGGHNGELRYFRTLPAGATTTPTPTNVITTVTPTPTRIITPTPTPIPGALYVVSYVIQSDWGNGATVGVTITNKTANAVNGWTLAFTFPGNQTISNLWNGTYTQSGASVSVKDAGFNANIPAGGGSVNFGFNLNYSGSNPKPTSFTLNGIVCGVQ